MAVIEFPAYDNRFGACIDAGPLISDVTPRLGTFSINYTTMYSLM